MPPTARKKPRSLRAVEPSAFPTWDELVAEATVDIPPYRLPLPEIHHTEVVEGKRRKVVDQPAEVIEIPVPTGDRYFNLSASRNAGDAVGTLFHLIPDPDDRVKVLRAAGGAHFPIWDVIASKVIRHYYGLKPTEPRPPTDDLADDEQGDDDSGE